jgi:hypothetical protein
MSSTPLQIRASGLVLDVPAHELGPEVYSGCNNIRFRPSGASIVGGVTDPYGAALVAPLHTQGYDTLTGYEWVYIGQAGSARFDGSAHSAVISPAGTWSLIEANSITGCNLNGVQVVASADSLPMYLDRTGAPEWKPLPGWFGPTWRCASMRAFKNFLVAVNIDDTAGVAFTHQVRWSDAAPPGSVPGVWTPAPSNAAGQRECADTEGPLVDSATLGDALFLYKQNGVHRLDFIGPPLNMQLSTVERVTMGCLSRNCVSTVRRQHIVFGAGDLFRFDGQAAESIAEGRTRQTLFNLIDDADQATCFCVTHKSQSEVWFCVPSKNFALVWYWPGDKWSMRDLPPDLAMIAAGRVTNAAALEAWDDQAMEWDDALREWDPRGQDDEPQGLLGCDPTGVRLLRMDDGPTMLGATLVATLEKASMPLTEGTQVKQVDELWPRATGSGVFEMSLGSQMTQADPIAWDPLQPYTLGVSDKLDPLIEGRYVSMRLRATSGGWEFAGADLKAQPAGDF